MLTFFAVLGTCMLTLLVWSVYPAALYGIWSLVADLLAISW